MGRLTFVMMVLAFVGLQGCATGSQVNYSEGDRAAPDLSFFMDRAGDLYPPASIRVDERALVKRRSPEAFATLKALYGDYAQAHDARWDALLAAVAVTPTGDFAADWTQVQAALRTDLARRITQARAGKDDVILLIHGFNNTYAEASAWYDLVATDFARYEAAYGRKPAFVRMYWNGLTGSPPTIWTAAQANGPSVGLELRRLLNQLPQDVSLRVFTHSSGAFVMTNALGDGSGPYPNMDEPYFTHAAGDATYPLPTLRDLRLAMLVPAQPYTAYSEFIRAGRRFGLVPQRVIIGTSTHDFATGKARAFTPCTAYGATCMTTKPQEACRHVWGDLEEKPMIVDFSQPLLKSHPHQVAAYMKDPEWPQLARALLADDPGTPDGEAMCDRPEPSDERPRP